MKAYDFRALEQKWRPYWRSIELYRTPDPRAGKKHYILDYFPYPSGAGLSVGHCRNYVPSCVSARFHRMKGDRVLHPMGWDAFGLPAENYAVLHGVKPRDSTREFTANYRRQLELIECSYDWSREMNSSDPEYYRWTQWFFLLLFERGLAYRAFGEQWWCPKCRTILANEQVEAGKCWRCQSEVSTKSLCQWYFKITDYTERLLADLDALDWPEHIKAMQRHWISGDSAEPEQKLRDWLISRQRYWGAPIPIIHCPVCGEVPVPTQELPVVLPEMESFAPSGDGRSPLARARDWLEVRCPRCDGPAERETDTMDGFACSSWYFLRFTSPRCKDGPFDPEAMRSWMPVDTYVGGAEHAVMHLLYARFWTKVMYDAGLVPFSEPFPHLKAQGVLHSAIDGQRMSKSRNNVVTPDEVVAEHGCDALRAYVLFLGPFAAEATWSDANIVGIERFLHRFWKLAQEAAGSSNGLARDSGNADFERERQRIVARVTSDFESFRFNTALAALMTYVNDLWRKRNGPLAPGQWDKAIETVTLLLAPVCPFICEEIWQEVLRRAGSVHRAAWPTYDPECITRDEVTVVVQVNGKVRDRLTVPPGLAAATLRERALASAGVQRQLGEKSVTEVIVVPDRLINILTSR
ncbi:MAG TPA: leucine--tRNA ligase [Polyangiaceae bacterium]|nr:leucine--tRNA ligase [Polyangiaceae bacterium]